MTVWNTRPVSEQPHVTLIQWSILETEKQERHFCGYCVENAEGRVSSAIRTFDPAIMRGITRSGRCYALDGPPGFNLAAAYVWDVWCRVNRVKRARDVTDEIVRSGSCEGNQPTPRTKES